MSLLDQPGRHPLSVLMVFAALFLFGVVSFFFLNLEELPELPLPALKVVAQFPGFPVEEMQQLITIPLENALIGVRGITAITSVSKSGLAALTLGFDWDSRIEQAALEVREAVDSIYPYLPEGVGKPLVFTESLSDSPLITLACIPAEGRSIRDLYIPVKYDLKNSLRALDGVASISLKGLRKPEIQVETDMEALYGMNSSLSALASYLGQFLVDHPVGKIREGTRERLVRISSGDLSPQEIARLPIQAGSSVKLGDIASVSMEEEDAVSLYLYQGRAALGLEIFKTASAGTISTAKAVREALPILNQSFEDSFSLVLLEDASLGIRQSVFSLILSLVLGLSAAVFVLFRVYRGRNIPLISSLSIPLTMVLVFFFLYLLKITLNTVSLLGMVIGIGLIADNTIIVLEEMREKEAELPHHCGRVLQGIFPAVLSSSLTTILVFLPPLFLSGIVSHLFRDLILTVILLILISFAVSHFFAPACYILMKRESPQPSRRLKRVEKSYRRILLFLMGDQKTAKPKGRATAVYGGLVLLLILMVSVIPLELLPSSPARQVIVEIELPGDWDAQAVSREASWLSGQFLKEMDPCFVNVSAGYEKDSLKEMAGEGLYLQKIRLVLGFDKAFSKEMIDRVGDLLARWGYGEAHIHTPQNSLEKALLPEEEETSHNLQAVLRFVPDEESLRASGITAALLQDELAAVISGRIAGEVPFDREKISLRVRGSLEYRNSPASMAALKLSGREGAVVFSELGHLVETLESRELVRWNRGASPKEKDRSIDFSVFGKLYLFALILMFLVLGIQTESFRRASLLLLALPVSLLGGLLFTGLCGLSLNLYSFMGILIMQGTVINTAILLLNGMNGSCRGEILFKSSKRLRPVISTTMTTLFALFPILLQSLFKGDPTGGMAAAVIGGMLIGTPLILLFIPLFLLYSRKSGGGRVSIL
ncbi:MAG: hypothetical protein B6241_05350 [Spirochaetaceae bacterium 4572_59]|nr:MAG: hypothetical protein B6241_05350 [Spirochaetaceae bacterium 4572_59]